MIYLIITASINDKYSLSENEARKARYLTAISKTLQNVPEDIQPIIVENNGVRETYLDNLYDRNGRRVPILYTNNNVRKFKNKGVNEILDIKSVIEEFKIQDNDLLIKLTGRYAMLSDSFIKQILSEQTDFDAFVKFFGTCSLKFETYDCILGCYAIQAKYLKLWNHLSIENYPSPEVAFAKYVKFSGARVKEIEHLDVECCFAEDGRILVV